jgi:hypothetical protein
MKYMAFQESIEQFSLTMIAQLGNTITFVVSPTRADFEKSLNRFKI